mmetsp:Transcript_7125/g.10859  ORF Transcript_7125/g.10859 Transcript_7125/m.10859 type:complete len:163 (-) Transcript_7125:1307-1795(-)
MFIDNGKVDQGSEVKIRVLDKQKVSPPSTDEGKQSPIVQVKKLRSNRGVPPNRMGINYNLMSLKQSVMNGKISVDNVYSLLASDQTYVPTSYWDAMKCPDRIDWINATRGHKIMNLMFVYAVKTDEKGRLKRDILSYSSSSYSKTDSHDRGVTRSRSKTIRL